MNNIPSIFATTKKLAKLITKKDRIKWMGIVLFALLSGVFEILTAGVIVLLAKTLATPEVGQKYLALVGIHAQLTPAAMISLIAVICGLTYLLKNTISAIEIFYQNFFIQNSNHHLKLQLLQNYSKINYAFHLTRNSSTGVSIMQEDAENVGTQGIIPLAAMLSESIVFLALIGFVVYMDPSLATVIFGIGLLLYLIMNKILLPKFYRWGLKSQNETWQSNHHLFQFFFALKEIKILNKQDFFISAYEVHSKKKGITRALHIATSELPRMILEVTFVGLFVVAVSYMCLEHDSPTQMMGILGGYLYAGFRLMPGLNRIIHRINAFKAVIPSIDKIYDEYTRSTALQNDAHCPDLKFEKNIVLHDVCFRYMNVEKDTLHNVNLEIKKGECLGIMGETGSGKSTMVDIILGLLEPRTGNILIDERYPAGCPEWRQKIGYVPQVIYLCDDTIRANIAFGEKKEDIDDARIQRVVESAQLQQFVQKLPLGLNTIVGERGVRLSGGERQRIAIARALYHSPEVLVFDEATSALDNETEARLMQTVYSISKERTVIMIAHRLSTLKKCDRIIHMQNGKIKEELNYKDIET